MEREGFCHHKADVAARKVEYPKSALRAGAVVGTQEVHGPAARVNALIDRVGLGYQAFASFGDGVNESLGGVAAIFPFAARADLSIHSRVFAQARVARVSSFVISGEREGRRMTRWNVRDRDLPREQVANVAQAIRRDLLDVESNPQQRFAIVAGDFNYGENVEVEGPLAPGGGPSVALHPRGRIWRRALAAAAGLIPVAARRIGILADRLPRR